MKFGDKPPFVLALIIVIGYAGVQWFLLTHDVSLNMREIIMRTLGTLDMALGAVIGYFFGSSASSKAKDAAIHKALEK